jgi:hypothetical protein
MTKAELILLTARVMRANFDHRRIIELNGKPLPYAATPEQAAHQLGKLLRLATKLARLAVMVLNAPTPEERQAISGHEEKARAKAKALADSLGIGIEFSDEDVRGFPVFLVLPNNPSNSPRDIGWGIG